MEENRTEGVVVAEKYLAPDKYLHLSLSGMGTTLSIMLLCLESENPSTFSLIIGLVFIPWLMVTLFKMIEYWIRPTAVIKDFGDRFTVYYAFGKTRTFRDDEVQEFIAKPYKIFTGRYQETDAKYGVLLFKSYSSTYRTGVVKYVETVRMVLNSKRPYYPKQQL